MIQTQSILVGIIGYLPFQNDWIFSNHPLPIFHDMHFVMINNGAFPWKHNRREYCQLGYNGQDSAHFPGVDGRRHHLAGSGVRHAVAVTIAKKYLKFIYQYLG